MQFRTQEHMDTDTPRCVSAVNSGREVAGQDRQEDGLWEAAGRRIKRQEHLWSFGMSLNLLRAE